MKQFVLIVSLVMLVASDSMLRAEPQLPRRTTERPSGANSVFVRGRVRSGGYVAWTEGITLSEAIEAAGGLTPYAFWIVIYSPRIEGADAGSSRQTTIIRIRDYFKNDAIKASKLVSGSEVLIGASD